MSYLHWFEQHAAKHRNIIDKLLKKGLDKEAIIDYFDFDAMVHNEPDFCELYKTQTKCHDMEKLNCYLCACPNFRFNDAAKAHGGITTYSHCSINSKDGKVFSHEQSRHQDCSACTVPHHREYVASHFDHDWLAIMRSCPQDESGS